MDERDQKAMNEELNQPSCLAAEYLRRAGGEAHSHVGKQKLINGTQLSYIISPPCVNTLCAVRV